MTSEEQLVSRELYGGAITLHLPARFADISDFRPVPDHQEVWADASADDSLVLEIVEQDPSVTDAGCGMHYWNDLVAANDSTAAEMQGVTALGPADIPQLPPGSVRYACLVSGSMAASKGRQSAAAANRIAVLLAAVRLPSVKSDLLLTLHSPIVISSESQAAEHAGAGVKQRYIAAPLLFSSILASLIVNDWSLFGA